MSVLRFKRSTLPQPSSWTSISTLHVTCQTTHQCSEIANLAQSIAFLCESSNDSLTVAVPRRGNGGPSARHGIWRAFHRGLFGPDSCRTSKIFTNVHSSHLRAWTSSLWHFLTTPSHLIATVSDTRRISVRGCLTLSLWWRVLDVASHHSGWSLNRPPCRKRKSGHHSLSCSWFRISHVSFALGFLETSHVGFFCTLVFIGAFPEVAYDVLYICIYMYMYVYVDMKGWFIITLRGVRLNVFWHCQLLVLRSLVHTWVVL